MDALLERTFEAEQRHFWFRGFRRFVAPLIAEATAGRSNPGCSMPAAARARTFLSSSSTARRSASSCLWRGIRVRARPRHAAVDARQRDASALRGRVDRRGAVVRRALLPRSAGRTGGDRGDVQGAPARGVRRDQRRGARHAEGRSFRARRRSAPVHEAGAPRKARAGRLSA